MMCQICTKPIEEDEGIEVLGDLGVTKGWIHEDCLQWNIIQLLKEKPEYEILLRRIIDFEERNIDERQHTFSGTERSVVMWRWSDMGVPAATLNKLVNMYILTIVLSTRSTTDYTLVDRKVTKDVLDAFEEAVEEEGGNGNGIEIPADIFDIIVDYDDIKGLIKDNLSAPQIAFGFFGGPATGKTLFLLEIERLGGVYVDATRMSASALGQVLAQRPRFILIDEIDKLKDPTVLGVLNTVIEEGKLVETISGKIRNIELPTQVFVAGLTDAKLPEDFKSRLIDFHFKPYTRGEFIVVVENYLVKREKCPDGIAGYIAVRVYDELNKNIRTARNIYKLCRGDISKANVDRKIEILKKYKKGFNFQSP